MIKKLLSIVLFVLLAAGCNQTSPVVNTPAPEESVVYPKPVDDKLTAPINNAVSRITKKPFGIYITPKTSPVQPEKFSGYHTGTDFETTPTEAKTDIAVYAACNGKLIMKKYATGYGGVAVQACKLNGQDVTIIYGHLRLASITTNTGQMLNAGQQFAVLGSGHSTETDGERKHLHFGIHIGTAINILGYVQKQTDLSGWLDTAKYLQ